ncbi:MAG: M24 family metallopeptidase, partial [Acidobacteriota bacterium]|nr:M24 family metallopeptidase [Acidobacteriota bacterium]
MTPPPLAPPLGPLPMAFRARVRDRLRVRAVAAELDGLLILAPGNLTYSTGWHFSINERPMGLWLPVSDDARLLVPHLELDNALEVPGVAVSIYDEFPGQMPPVLWMIGQTGARRLGIDALEARLLDAVRNRVDRLDLIDHVRPERIVKHPDELALIREAARFADLALERLLDAASEVVGRGGTELDLMADCTDHARAALAAAHGQAFHGTKIGITATVHSGPRAALPHGAVRARTPQRGEPVIAGIGCSLGGYHAESGATLVCGAIGAEQRRVMQVMDDATRATVDALARGLPCADVNAAALASIRAAGLGDAIRHRIGHGMGVEGHEAPWLAPGDATLAAPGMV